MPDSKITALTALTSADPAVDMFPVVDVSDTTMAASGTTKRISINNILACSPTATLASATITGDLTVRSGNKLILNRADNAISSQLFDAGGGAGLTVNNLNGDGFLLKVASNSVYQVGSSYIQTWYDGTGGTRMTLNATGLGVGSTPAAPYRILSAKTSGGGQLALTTGAAAGSNASPLNIDLDFLGFTNETRARIRSTDQTSDTGNGFLSFWTQNSGTFTEKMRLSTEGNVGIGVTPSAGKGCLQLSSGINFPATQVASSDANTLDDYEEGSFVPTLNSGTFSSASCRYTKIGNMVTIFFDVTVGTGGGDRITNLPFAAASTSTVASGIYTNNQTYAAGTTAPVVVVGGSSSTLFFRTVGTGVAFSAMTLTAAANLTGSISYFV